MNNTERLNLSKMIKTNNVVDQTERIRELRHSAILREEIQNMENLKKKYSKIMKTDPDKFDEMCVSECNFLFTNYTDIFNKLKKNELNLEILYNFISVLSRIENGEINQHEGSFEVGKLLKELYVDTALRRIEGNDDEKINKPIKKAVNNISWKQYKFTQVNN